MSILQDLLDGTVEGSLTIRLGAGAPAQPFALATLVEATWKGYAPSPISVQSQGYLPSGWSTLNCSGIFNNYSNSSLAIPGAWLVGEVDGVANLLAVCDFSSSPFTVTTLGPFALFFNWLIYGVPQG